MTNSHIRDRVKELRRVPASELLEHPRNWRRHPEAQSAAMRGILAEIGFADAVIARETPEGLMLIDGHLRRDVMGDQEVPVLVVDVTEEEADKMLLTLDPLAAMAEQDDELLGQLLASAQFDDVAIQAMLAALSPPFPPGEPKEDDPGPQMDKAEELREKWGVERGQVWEVGRHRLMCGDVTDDADMVQLMSSEQGRLLITDPPYGIAYDGSPGHRQKRDEHPAKLIKNDALGIGQGSWWEASLRNLPFDGDAYIFAAPGPLMAPLATAAVAMGIEHHQWLIWAKQQFVLGGSHYHYQHEHIFYGWKGSSSWNGSRTEHSLWAFDRPHTSPLHPTTKPVEIIAKAITLSSLPGDSILDPFLGSGTTMVAAEQLGRICYGMEIEPKYVAVTLERMSGMGLEPKLVTG